MTENRGIDEMDDTAAAADEADVLEPEVPTRKPKAAKQDRATMALLFVAALVAVGGIGFAAGRVTAPSSGAAANNGINGNGNRPGGFGRNLPSLAPGQTFNIGQFGGGNGGTGGLRTIGGGVTGTVQSITPTTMTVQLANGTTVTVDLNGSTTYHGETSASASDIKTGSSVTVQIDAAGLAGESAAPGASTRTVTAKDVLITKP